MNKKNVKKVKFFQYRKPDGTILEQDVPTNIDQSALHYVDK